MAGEIVGYRVDINKEEGKLENVFVIVSAPFGLVGVPIEMYLLQCDAIEMLEVIFDSGLAVKNAISQCDFEVAIA